MGREMDFAGVEELLRGARFDECKLLWSSSNYVYLAVLCSDDEEQVAAVYKPEAGETPLWDFPGGLYRREVAAYELSKLIGWNFVPPTVVRDGPQGVGSLQLYVEHDRQSHFFEQREDAGLVPQLQRMAVFDYVTNNADRKGGHCLLDDQSRVWGIDHGLCFHTEYKMRTVIWDWAEEAIPQAWLDDVERLACTLESNDKATAPLREHLEEDELDRVIERSHDLAKSGVFPVPGPHRSYPLPLV
jgi:uncharacterized repeat protein (TIGR03843 family)